MASLVRIHTRDGEQRCTGRREAGEDLSSSVLEHQRGLAVLVAPHDLALTHEPRNQHYGCHCDNHTGSRHNGGESGCTPGGGNDLGRRRDPGGEGIGERVAAGQAGCHHQG